MSNKRFEEPLLKEDNSRFTQLPYKFPKLQKAYDVQEGSFWTAKEIDYGADLEDWKNLTKMKNILSNIFWHFLQVLMELF